MSRPGGTFKADGEARALWGGAYADIPKSVFAVAAWHMADCLGEGEALARFLEEIDALAGNGCITEAQAKAALRAIAKEQRP